MEIVKLLSKANSEGIHFWIQDGTLKYRAPAGVFTKEWKENVVSRKQEIILFLEQRKWNSKSQEKILPAQRTGDLVLSYGQKWLWLMDRMDGRSADYHIPAAFQLKGNLNNKKLCGSLNRIIRRHEILRTVYREKDGEVYQVILPDLQIELPVADKMAVKMEAREAECHGEMEKLMSIPFDLSAGPLFRAMLIKLAENEHVLLLLFHHIICDNQSMQVFLAELASLYTSYDENEDQMPLLPIQYVDYAYWQAGRLREGLKDLQLSYWQETLKGLQNVPELYGDYNRPDVISARSIREHFVMPEEIAAQLKAVSQACGCTFYVILLSAFKLLLYQYSGLLDLIIGTPVAGRDRDELQQLIGLFFNTVVIRTQIDTGQSFTEYVETVKASVTGAFAHQDIPFELLAEELEVPRQTNKTPVFQVLFNMYSTRYQGKLGNVSIEAFSEDFIGGQNRNSKFDITLLAIEYEEGLHLDFSFKADLYRQETVHWLVEQFKVLTRVLAGNPGILISELPVLPPLPHQQVLPEQAFTPLAAPDTEQSIIRCFDQQTALHPHKTAVEMGAEKRSYLELQAISLSLKHTLRSCIAGMPRLSQKERIRYGRQLILDGWGIEAQEKLKGTTVFAAGAGGSGSPVIMQLALLGVGCIIICDFDSVELSNLNRQALHDESRIGMNKARSAALTVQRMNPYVKTVVIEEKIDYENISQMVGNAAVIFDNVDNIETKFAISECAVAKGIPHVISSMIERSAYAVVFHTPYTPCFHCCYDKQKLDTVRELRKDQKGFQKVANSVASPALFLSAGFAVNEALKIVLGFENPAYNKYFFFNNQASEHLSQTRGYQIVTYPFSQYFLETCKKQGFDWEKGYTGRMVEELNIEKNPECPLCAAAAGKEFSDDKYTANENETCEDPDIVALFMDRSIAMVEAILGVLRSGYAFVPIDPEYPEERIRLILEDTNTHCVICDDSNEPRAKEICQSVNAHIKVINSNLCHKHGGEEILPATDESGPDSLAYVLYTSGSMGRPKGVTQTHRNVLHYTMNYTNGLQIGENDRLSLIPSFIFSAAMMDVFAAMTKGATLCLYDLQRQGVQKLGKWLDDNQISVYHSVPTVFRNFITDMNPELEFSRLRVIDFGGEALSAADIEAYRSYFPDTCILVNGLGATELNVIRQYMIHKETPVTGGAVPVGYPVEDTLVYLIGPEGNVLGYNQPGEIIIKSRYLSPGYWGEEEQTKAAFRQDPTDLQMRTFHTGDLGRIRPDGCLEHLGRIDLQIKIRGIRIEPMEIEAKILEITGVRETAVIAGEGKQGNKYLIAYLTTEEFLAAEEIQDLLRPKLPAYMVPSYFVKVDRLPVTATGKIDRKALAALSVEAESGTKYAEPENELQKLLVSVWQTVLKQEQISILDHFIDLGGDSIKAIKMYSALSELGYTVKVSDIMETQNIRELSERVKAVEEEPDWQEPEWGDAPLTPTQIDYFGNGQFTFQNYEDMHIWNISTMIYKMNGFRQDILQRAIDVIVARHDALRTIFPARNGERRQYYRKNGEKDLYGFYCFDLVACENAQEIIKEEAQKIQYKHNLDNGPLMQVALFKTASCDYVLFSVHHMICDLISANILITDFRRVYEQLEAGKKIKLLPPSASFKKWSESINEAACSQAAHNMIEHFVNISQAPVEQLPTDYPCTQRLNKNGMKVTAALSTALTARILEAAHARYQVTADVMLLALLGRAIKKWCGISRVRIEVAINGRMGGFGNLDVSQTVGWFATSFPIMIDSSGEEMGENFKEVTKARKEVPGDGSGFFLLRDLTLPTCYPHITLDPPKEIYFNYFGEQTASDLFKITGNSSIGISDIPTGNCMAGDTGGGHKIGLIVSHTDGRFVYTFSFADTEYKKETIEKLVKCYTEELEAVAR